MVCRPIEAHASFWLALQETIFPPPPKKRIPSTWKDKINSKCYFLAFIGSPYINKQQQINIYMALLGIHVYHKLLSSLSGTIHKYI